MPNLGEIKRGRQIGKNDKAALYIYCACKVCDKERWVKYVKGRPDSLCCRTCTGKKHIAILNQRQKGEKNPAWRGGRQRHSSGYFQVVLQPDNFFFSMADRHNMVLEHRLVMAKHLGRCLHLWEIVHHKHTKYPAGTIEDKQDNRIENLQLVSDDRHNQITLLENRIRRLENRILLLEAENVILRVDYATR